MTKKYEIYMKMLVDIILLSFFIPLDCYSSVDGKTPIENFVREPAWSNVRISPEGTKLLANRGENDISSLVSYEIDKKKFNVILKDTDDSWYLTWSKWIDDEHFIQGTRVASRNKKYNTYSKQLYIGHYAGEMVERMIPPEHALYPVRQIVNWLDTDPDHILFSRVGDPSVYKYNIDSKRLGKTKKKFGVSYEKVISYPGFRTDLVSDVTGRYFAAVNYDRDLRRIYYRDYNNPAQSLVWSYSMVGYETVDSHPKFIYPLGFDPGKPIMYVSGLHENRTAVYTIDMSKDEHQFALLAAHDRYDLDGSLITSPKDGRPVGIYHSYDGFSATYWDKSYASLKKMIDTALPGSNAIVSVSRDETKYVVFHSTPESPGAFFLGDRKTKALSYIGSSYPELMEAKTSERKRHQIKARDDLDLEVFVTSPTNADSTSSSSVVVIPHASPFGKDRETFDLMPAFLADRGFTVLQVNYRGSSGYGIDFLLKAKHNYNVSIQHDIEDATRWLIQTQNVDASRVCIMGKGFGGYSALMAMANKPELYKCGISVAGITDLVDWSTHNMFVYGYSSKFVNMFFGGRWSNRKELHDSSPVNLTEKITQPVLIIHGIKDVEVPVAQSNRLYKKLKKSNKNVYSIRFKDGDHSISKYSYRKKYFQEVETFLDKHL